MQQTQEPPVHSGQATKSGELSKELPLAGEIVASGKTGTKRYRSTKAQRPPRQKSLRPQANLPFEVSGIDVRRQRRTSLQVHDRWKRHYLLTAAGSLLHELTQLLPHSDENPSDPVLSNSIVLVQPTVSDPLRKFLKSQLLLSASPINDNPKTLIAHALNFRSGIIAKKPVRDCRWSKVVTHDAAIQGGALELISLRRKQTEIYATV